MNVRGTFRAEPDRAPQCENQVPPLRPKKAQETVDFLSLFFVYCGAIVEPFILPQTVLFEPEILYILSISLALDLSFGNQFAKRTFDRAYAKRRTKFSDILL